MAIKVADNFLYQGRKPLDNRILVNTIADMAAMVDAILYDGMIAYVKSDKKFYVYDSTNTIDPTLAKWRELTTGGGTSVEEYLQNTKYKKDTLVYLNDKLARVVANYTSDNTGATINDSFNLDITNNNIVLVGGTGTASVEEYLQNKKYKKDNLVYANDEIARVVVDFTSDNTLTSIDESFQLDITNGNLTQIPTTIHFKQLADDIEKYIGGQIFIKEADVSAYKTDITISDATVILKNGTQLTNEQKTNAKILFVLDLNSNIIGIASIKSYNSTTNEFTINAQKIGDGGTLEFYKSTYILSDVIDSSTMLSLSDLVTTSPITDIKINQIVYDAKGTLARINSVNTVTSQIGVTTIVNSREYMPIAPDTKEFRITNAGTGYTIGDIIETTTPGTFGEVTNVGVNGEIISLQLATTTTQSVTGTNAFIDYIQTIYGGYGNNWAALSNASVLVAETVAEKFEYIQGYTFTINNAGTGYTVGDIIGTDNLDVFVEVKNVGTNGEITEVKYVRNSTVNTTGAGASITTTSNPDMFIIPDSIWNIGMSVFSFTNDDGAMTEFYKTDNITTKYNAGPNSKIYKFEYDSVNGVIYQSFYTVQGGTAHTPTFVPIAFDGVNDTFNLPTDFDGTIDPTVIVNGLYYFNNEDYTINLKGTTYTITFDTVYDTFDKCKIMYTPKSKI